MSERYFWNRPYAGGESLPSDFAELSGDESHHLIRVMRQKSGDTVTLFDGCGGEYKAEIIEIHKDRVMLRLLETRTTNTEAKRHVTIAASLPKGDRQKWMIEKLTELGCFHFIPLAAKRGVAKCSAGVTERLRRQVLEASKQCGRSRLMTVEHEKSIADCLAGFWKEKTSEASAKQDFQHVAYIAHPLSGDDFQQRRLSDLLNIQAVNINTLPQDVLVLIGPEGGFTATEITQAMKLGATPLDLGTRILRIETAAIMLTAVLTILET
ncbi:MAG: 16S rRNA (uracil(1498)-N(3))-methyltransferase [Planctomycetaceae bacterium]|jgi:16S rRNA (uracil1498-N3)-methyltransferase|nr:16S rRNA (uracil(1498)-N(3))-methyltransferase [Planctomycetaceae bacterium]